MAVDVFLKLSTNHIFLEALLSKDPMLFATICSHLLEGLQSTPAGGDLSVWARQSFLNVVLPKQCSAPSAYVKVLDILMGPSRDALHPASPQLLEFLASAPFQLLSSLSDATIDNCHQHWKASLRSQENADVLRSLHLASCFQANARNFSSPEASANSSVTLSPSLSIWLDKCRMRFSQAEVHHVVQRTVLSVLKWCSEVTEVDADAVSSVRRAGSLLRNIDAAHIRTWVSTNEPIMRKLSQKLIPPSLPATLRAEALVVLSMLDEECTCPEWTALMARVCRTLITTPFFETHNEVGALRLIISRFVYVLDQRRPWSSADAPRQHAWILQSLVRYVLAGCQPGKQTTVARLGQIELGTLLVKAFDTDGHLESGLRLGAYLHAICEIGVPEWWPLDLSSPDEPQNCASSAVCVHVFEAKRQELCLLVTKLTIRAASLSANTVNGAMFDLLQQRLGVSGPEPHCRYPDPFRVLPLPKPSRVESVSSAHRSGQLRRQLTAQSHDSASLVEHYIVQICQDLQGRCDEVETPLREARADTQRLETALVRVRDDFAQSEKEKQLLSNTLKDTGRERVINNEKVANLGSEVGDLQAELKHRRLDIRDLEERAEKRSIEYQNHMTELESSHKSELAKVQQQLLDQSTRHEEELVFQRNELKKSKEEAIWLKEHMDQTTTQLQSDLADSLRKLHDEHSVAEGAAQSEIERLNALTAMRDADIDRLKDEIRARDRDLNTSNEQGERDRSTIGELQFNLEASKADCQEQRSQLHAEKQSHATISKQEARQSADLKECLSRIVQFEKSESALRKQCKDKDKALKKAQRAEASVFAILQNARQPIESPLTSTRAASPSQQTASPTPRLLEGSFVSEEDADYSGFLRLGECASRRRRTSADIR